ncbi:hypothetical protein OTU49_011809, partial [Cherax quadricarinatus]
NSNRNAHSNYSQVESAPAHVEPAHAHAEPVHAHADPAHAHAEPVHIHAEPVHALAESQPHVHQSQYIQREYSSPLTVDMHRSSSYHHMPLTATSVPAPMYTLAYAMPIAHTQTLPHPRSSHVRNRNNALPLQRRSSLYMEPVSTPLVPVIAPPPAY